MRIEPSSLPSRAARTQVDRPATMRDPSRAPIDVILRNLSETGALLEADQSLPVGTLVSLGIAGVGIHIGRITRLVPNGMAAEFIVPLDPAAIARAKTAETIFSIAFPQIAVQHTPRSDPEVTQSVHFSNQPVVEARQVPRSVRLDAWAKTPPWAGWAATAAIIVLLALLLL